jgi:NAD(P)-dependent dehydrogenase (short-subunit alcohol dehydrogenase family)
MAKARNMKGKRVIVTGAGTGIGKGIALGFAERGAAVALHYSRSSKGAEEAVAAVRKEGGTAEAFQADFTRVEQVSRMTKEAIEFLGGIDVLVNNAGLTTNIPLQDITPEKWDLLFHINIRGMFFTTKEVAGPMIEQKSGSIINISSVHAFRAYVDHSLYASTKAAIVGFTRTLAVELAPHGVRVNAIAPGAVLVDNYYRNAPDVDWKKELAKSIPIGFVGEPSDIADIAAFLASDDSRYIVGETIVADGGQTIVIPFGEGFKQRPGFTWAKDYTPGL